MSSAIAAVAAGRFLVFDVGGDGRGLSSGAFALDVASVFQVIEPESVARVPLAPAVVLGILNHHGRIVTVVDPGPLLGLGQQQAPVSQVVILRSGLRGTPNLGLQVVRSHGIVSKTDLTPTEVAAGPCVAWVARSGRRLIQVLDLEPWLQRLSRLFGSKTDTSEPLEGVTV